MSSDIHFFIICLLLSSMGSFVYMKMIRKTAIKEFASCSKNLPVLLDDVNLSVTGKGEVTLNGFFLITEDLGNTTKCTVAIDKCESFTNKETCEYFITTKFNDPCGKIVEEGSFWTPIFHGVRPKLSCPLKKGTYMVNKAGIDAELMARVLPPGHYWRGTIKLYVGHRLVCCFYLGATTVEIRGKAKV